MAENNTDPYSVVEPSTNQSLSSRISDPNTGENQDLETAHAREFPDSDALEEHKQFLTQLEQILNDSSNDANLIRKLCKHHGIPSHLRPKVWLAVLGSMEKDDGVQSVDMDSENSLPETQLHLITKICDKIVTETEKGSLPHSDIEGCQPKLMQLLQHHYNTHQSSLNEDTLLIQGKLLLAFLQVFPQPPQAYSTFISFLDQYACFPAPLDDSTNLVHVFRLLLQYHDPDLLQHLQNFKFKFSHLLGVWVQGLFSTHLSIPVFLSFLDHYIIVAQPFLILFMALVFFLNSKEFILSSKSSREIEEFLLQAPSHITLEDVKDFVELSVYYISQTPSSFSPEYFPFVVSGSSKNARKPMPLELCLHSSVKEILIQLYLKHKMSNKFSYFIIDCRVAKEFDMAHLPTAFHLDHTLLFTDLPAFEEQLSKLMNLKGHHFCLLNSGVDEDNQYLDMVMSAFLKKGFPYVSSMKGGFILVEKLLKNRKSLLTGAQEHPGGTVKESLDIASKASEKFNIFSIALKEKTSNWKDIVEQKISQLKLNDSSSSLKSLKPFFAGGAPKNVHNSSSPPVAEHAIFTIGDDDDLDSEEGLAKSPSSVIISGAAALPFSEDDKLMEVVNVYELFVKENIIKIFPCNEVKQNGNMHPSYLVLMDNTIVKLAAIPGQQGCAHLMARRPLTTIAKISAKKKHPNLISIAFKIVGNPDSGCFPEPPRSKILVFSETYMIPEATEFTSVLTKQLLSGQAIA